MSGPLSRPKYAWLPQDAWDCLTDEYSVAANAASKGAPLDVPADQNRAMLIRFFLEQFREVRPIEAMTLRVIERDWGSVGRFEQEWQRLAADGRVKWIVFGLGFFDFKFHLYALHDDAPFCVSPALCWCIRDDLVALVGVNRMTYVARLWAHTDWTIAEVRLRCLEQPVDIFGKSQDCAAGACNFERKDEDAETGARGANDA